MKYKFLRLQCYNESPNEPNCYCVDAPLPAGMEQRDEIIEATLKPMFECIFQKLIPECPNAGTDYPGFCAWAKRYFGIPGDEELQ